MNVDVVNKGMINAKISSLTLPSSSAPDIDSISHSAIYHMITEKCAYNDGTEIRIEDIIKAGSSTTITCKHHYKLPSELTNDDLNVWNYYSSDQYTASGNDVAGINFVVLTK